MSNSTWFEGLANHGTDAVPFISQIPNWAPPVISMMGAVAYAIGIFIVLASIFQLRAIGEGSRQGTVGTVLVRIGIGVCLTSLPTVIDVSVMTVWGNGPQTFSYAPQVANVDTAKLFESLKYFFKAVGLAAIIKSLLIFDGMTRGTTREGFWKGAIHFLAGGFCWNFDSLLDLFRWAFNI